MLVRYGLPAVILGAFGPLGAEFEAPRSRIAAHALPLPSFHLEFVSDDLEQLRCRFSEDQLALLEKLNRIDRDGLIKLDKISVPDRWDLPETAYSSLPAWFSWAAYFPKAVVVSKTLQAFGAYEQGRLVRWGPISSGAAKSPTPAGVFHLNWRSKGRRSTVNRAWFLKWYFNFSNRRGHSFHEYELPGQPASHGCVRMLGRDAEWMYEWGRAWELDETDRQVRAAGTPVLILGAYDHQADRPWLSGTQINSGPLRLENTALPGAALELVAETLADKSPGDPSSADVFEIALNDERPAVNIETTGDAAPRDADLFRSGPATLTDFALHPWARIPPPILAPPLAPGAASSNGLAMFTHPIGVQPLQLSR